jgi:DNA-binding GntR family transcriptional regulator
VPAPAALLERLEELLEQQKRQAATGDYAAAAVTDRSFHAEIVRSGGNANLSRLYDQLRDRQLRMGVAVMHSHPDRIAKTLAEHEEILDALRAGDAEAAVGIVHRHVSWFSHVARGEVR